ncbi:electron transfer flavoprotein subunit alpha/FixB family protein [Chlorobium phaeobacteroides]|uniref:Electron transfer flavoprotein, alpha subunit n=1 Tax=Chlorobium phaeobacteroides (strain DSM 266 / SMG 266 / 2430) TaxID=290317 RepID=A1BJD1_CHLPD|nr:electron transfer flavoprotein subunit alpha/FixB family protein [Chlorobium phaeobacteroides]ABL66508.1 electron transfer flavoprotein, alpha subunit [Chlorobium phaeobacteroides DSM 266]
MKTLLIAESREGRLLDTTYELFGAAAKLKAETVLFLAGTETGLPSYAGTLYLADAKIYGEYNPDLHKNMILQVIEKENPDYVVFLHSSYGRDLAPRIAASLRIAQVSEVIDIVDGTFELTCCNARMHRSVQTTTSKTVLTIQPGAFSPIRPGGAHLIQAMQTDAVTSIEFAGYEPAEPEGIDLGKSEIIISAGRGIGTKENTEVIWNLAKTVGGEVGASRPVVDAGWIEHSRQIGSTGQTISPKLYIACGISGAIQHLAGIKNSGYIVAINKDREAPIGEVSDVLVVADVMQFLPALTEKLAGR